MKKRVCCILAWILMLTLAAGCTKQAPIDSGESNVREETNLVQETKADFFTEPTTVPVAESQPAPVDYEAEYQAFLSAHPEYNYYAFLDVNGDDTLEMLTANEVNAKMEPVNMVDLYVYDHGTIRLACDDIWAKYDIILYDNVNHWLAVYHGGTSGHGMSFYYLDEQLQVQEVGIDARCNSVDENGNEIWVEYYNGEEVNESTRQKYESVSKAWTEGNSESVIFQAVPKVDLIGTWKLYFVYDPNEEGYLPEVLVSSLDLRTDGTVNLMLGAAESEAFLWYKGTWTAEPVEDGKFMLQLDVTGGSIDFDEPMEENNCSVRLMAEVEGDCLVLERLSGEDIGLYDFEVYERNLEYISWKERQ